MHEKSKVLDSRDTLSSRDQIYSSRQELETRYILSPLRTGGCSHSNPTTPVSIRAGQSAHKLHSSSLQSSTYSLTGHLRSEMRSMFDSVVSRISSPGQQQQQPGAGARNRNKEHQTKVIALHLSYSFLLSHFRVTVYCVTLLCDTELQLFEQGPRNPALHINLK